MVSLKKTSVANEKYLKAILLEKNKQYSSKDLTSSPGQHHDAATAMFQNGNDVIKLHQFSSLHVSKPITYVLVSKVFSINVSIGKGKNYVFARGYW